MVYLKSNWHSNQY